MQTKEVVNAMSEQTVSIIVALLFFAVLGAVKNHFGMG